MANYSTVTLDPNGADFAFRQRHDAPQIWTSGYMFYGKVDVVMKAAPGAGIISSIVLLSDTSDEIDWEFSGNNFNSGGFIVQTNYFGKGVLGAYDRGTLPALPDDPTTTFHTYSLDWSPDRLIWSVDGQQLRVLNAADCTTPDHQYPQSPARVHLGLWDAGDADVASGTVAWAGGYTDLSKAPFIMNVKSVHIQNMNPAQFYHYTDSTGNSDSVDSIGGSTQDPTSAVTAAPSTQDPAPMPTTAPSPMCPDTDQTNYTAVDGSQFQLECSYDRPWGDMRILSLDSYKECIDTCATQGSSCVDIAWGPVDDAGQNGTCWIKTQVMPGSTTIGRWGALRVGEATATVAAREASTFAA